MISLTALFMRHRRVVAVRTRRMRGTGHGRIGAGLPQARLGEVRAR